jgi:primosomal protein N' (replication factor Y)
MAVVRARETKIPIVLASATPSVETVVNAKRGRYEHLRLPERFGGQHLPSVEAIDLRREGPPRGRFISPRLAEAVKIALERGEQALLFLNRRGFAPLTLCNACGHRLACPNCDAWLVDHRSSASSFAILRLFDAAAEQCPMRSEGQLRRGQSRRRAAGAGGSRTVSARASVLSSDLVDTMERLYRS